MAKPEMKQFTVRVPTRIYESAKRAADSVGSSLNQFVILAMAQRARRWRDPISNKSVTETLVTEIYDPWVCYHGACGGVAITECRGKKYGHHRRSGWRHEEHESWDFDTWAHENGVPIPGTTKIPGPREEARGPWEPPEVVGPGDPEEARGAPVPPWEPPEVKVPGDPTGSPSRAGPTREEHKGKGASGGARVK